MDKKYEYYAYRYFIIESDKNQISLLNLLEEKYNLFKKIFKNLEEKKKLDVIHRNRKFLLYFYSKIDDDIIVTKFAKETHHTKYVEGSEDIQEEQDYEFPFIFVIFNLKSQILLIQKKSTVFSSPFSAKNILESFFSNILSKNHYTFKIDEILYEEKFWEFIKEAEKIYSLQLNLKSPNLFRGRLKAEEFLKEQRSLFNNTELDVQLKNDEGNLTLLKENLQDFIRYIAEGGGSYVLIIMKNGIIDKIKSKLNIKKFFLKDINEEKERIKFLFLKLEIKDENKSHKK